MTTDQRVIGNSYFRKRGDDFLGTLNVIYVKHIVEDVDTGDRQTNERIVFAATYGITLAKWAELLTPVIVDGVPDIVEDLVSGEVGHRVEKYSR